MMSKAGLLTCSVFDTFPETPIFNKCNTELPLIIIVPVAFLSNHFHELTAAETVPDFHRYSLFRLPKKKANLVMTKVRIIEWFQRFGEWKDFHQDSQRVRYHILVQMFAGECSGIFLISI